MSQLTRALTSTVATRASVDTCSVGWRSKEDK